MNFYINFYSVSLSQVYLTSETDLTFSLLLLVIYIMLTDKGVDNVASLPFPPFVCYEQLSSSCVLLDNKMRKESNILKRLRFS